jgi:enamine deaminase RidA (YjgF/YER057c/UK114 family)
MNISSQQNVNHRLEEMGIDLPTITPPVAAFLPFVEANGLVYLSGHIAKKGASPWTGKVGESVTVEEAQLAARFVAVDLLATLRAACTDLNRVERLVRATVFVNSAPAFVGQHLVANGASDFLVEVFGKAGQHARSAIGVSQLPFGTCVEIELIAKIWN